MKTVLITGATGFVGSHVLEAFVQRADPAVRVIAACRDRRKLLSAFDGEVREGDLRDAAYRNRVVEGVDRPALDSERSERGPEAPGSHGLSGRSSEAFTWRRVTVALLSRRTCRG